MNPELVNSIFLSESADWNFEELVNKCFRHQYAKNPVYQDYVNNLSIDVDSVETCDDIPFLPIEFFKSRKVYAGDKDEEIQFFSSGTTGSTPAVHYLAFKALYELSFTESFKHFYGEPKNYCFLALLPSYLERENSSLVYMIDRLIRMSAFSESGFYLNNLDDLAQTLNTLEKRKTKTILIGVSYALLDFAERFPMQLKHTTVMETGGMKGRREELSKVALHKILADGFGLEDIHSEYGMTEILSQAYSSGKGIFYSPPWMRVRIRDPYDPFSYLETGRTGGVNIIDLANWHSCSFIETQDLGRMTNDSGFEILGRFDSSDIRGCNLLVQ